LILPNLVLTARHCVSVVQDSNSGQVACSKTTFGALWPPSEFRVTTDATAYLATKYVVEVLGVPGDSTRLCGQAVALLVLAEQGDAAEAVPLVPRVDTTIAAGDVYDAVGFGAIDSSGADAGTRRRLDGLGVLCLGSNCVLYPVDATEWVGEKGVCPGD